MLESYIPKYLFPTTIPRPSPQSTIQYYLLALLWARLIETSLMESFHRFLREVLPWLPSWSPPDPIRHKTAVSFSPVAPDFLNLPVVLTPVDSFIEMSAGWKDQHHGAF